MTKTKQTQIWSNYSTDPDVETKYQQNLATYQTLNQQVARVYSREDAENTKKEHPDYTILGIIGGKYDITTYCVYNNPHQLTIRQLALICDRGDLRHGYRGNEEYINILNS